MSDQSNDKRDNVMEKLERDDFKNGSTEPASNNPADQVVKSADRQLLLARKFVVFYNVGCIIAMFVAICSLFHTSSVKWMILYAIIFLVCFETTILMKLWYWVINTKCTLTRDMKLLRLDLAKTTGIESVETEIPPIATGYIRKQILWKIVIVALAVAGYQVYVGEYGGDIDSMVRPTVIDNNEKTFGCRRTVTIDRSGSAVIESEYSIPNNGIFPMDKLRIRAYRLQGVFMSTPTTFSEWSGEPIEAETQEKERVSTTTVRLDPPIMPGERRVIRGLDEYPSGATEEIESCWEWGYHQASYGYPESVHSYRIRLPEGAELTHVSPETAPSYTSTDSNGVTTVHIDNRTIQGNAFTADTNRGNIMIMYRLK